MKGIKTSLVFCQRGLTALGVPATYSLRACRTVCSRTVNRSPHRGEPSPLARRTTRAVAVALVCVPGTKRDRYLVGDRERCV